MSATVGLCIINLYTGECHLSEICDSQTYAHTISKIFLNDVTDVMNPPPAPFFSSLIRSTENPNSDPPPPRRSSFPKQPLSLIRAHWQG